jgi:hypothetical protein
MFVIPEYTTKSGVTLNNVFLDIIITEFRPGLSITFNLIPYKSRQDRLSGAAPLDKINTFKITRRRRNRVNNPDFTNNFGRQSMKRQGRDILDNIKDYLKNLPYVEGRKPGDDRNDRRNLNNINFNQISEINDE